MRVTPQQRKRVRSLHALTMVEALVVLLICALLIALLLPTVARARRSAKIAACASNLHQIGQALVAYRTEQHHWPDAAYLPPPFVSRTSTTRSIRLPVNEALAGFLPPQSEVYRCPADERAFDASKAASPIGAGVSYHYNTFLRTSASPEWRRWLMADIQFDLNHYALKTLVHANGYNLLRNDGSVHFMPPVGPSRGESS